MTWGVILILKEAYKDGPMWFIGSLLIPIVLALFIVKNPERVHAGRMTILKGMAPLALGLILMVAFSSKSAPAAAPAAVAKPAPVAVSPKPAPVPAPAPKPVATAAVPVISAAPAADPNAGYSVVAAACRNEIGLYCASARKTVKAAKACLEDYRDNLLPECKAALSE